MRKDATSGDMKLGAGPPCNKDIPIAFPHVLKSPAFRATVELTGFPSLKNLSFIMINNSAEKKTNKTNENELSKRNSFTNAPAKFWWDKNIML